MRINLKDIFSKMDSWYKAYISSNREDSSYNDLYQALFTMYCANLISYETRNKIVAHDKMLFEYYM